MSNNKGGKPTDKFKHCNHFHELTEDYKLVDFGDGEFVANVKAIPLLQALNELGIKTRTHHITEETQWFSILLDNIDIEVKTVNEVDSIRTKYNGKKELLIRVGNNPLNSANDFTQN